jgi:signal transduction histidine kinase
LVVDDDGSGISERDLPRVLEPFYTTRRERGGSGLGLSIAHGIVEDHAGTITIEPRKEGGTRVLVQFATNGTPATEERTNG